MGKNEQLRVGILGSGNIFGRYVDGLTQYPEIHIARVADIDVARAKQAAVEYEIPAWGDDAELYADESIDIVVNLTPPTHHAGTSIAALESGKHVYVEKPLATTVDEGRAVLAAVAASGKRLGSAPDTFLGSASQTARRAIDEGLIGTPIGASAFVRHSKAETWHPDPRFLFHEGGGPVMDMGPYYLAVLVNCLGPIECVTGATRIGAPQRTVTAPDRVVDVIDVRVPTHTSSVLTFASGAIATTLMSFDIWHTELPRIEVYGTEGTLSLADPNHFDGAVRCKRHRDETWTVLDPVVELFGAVGTREQTRRGLGVRDLLGAIEGGPHRANAQFAFHVLEAMCAVEEASRQSRVVRLDSTCERPAPRYPA